MARELLLVIATKSDAPLLRRTLESLKECERPTVYRGTIIVENGSRGEAEALCQLFSESLRTRYMYVPEANKSSALNAALDSVGDSLILLADDDVRFARETLAAYAAAAEGVDAGLYFGGPFGVDYEEPPPQWLRPYLPTSATGWEPANQDQLSAAPFFLGFNWAAFAADLRKAGGFNPKLGPGRSTLSTVGDEDDMQQRLREMGVTPRYVPGARVWHYVPRGRCTAEWALDRRYRASLAKGVQLYAAGGLTRYCQYVVRTWLVGCVRLLAAALKGEPTRNFHLRYLGRRLRGLLDGYWLMRRSMHQVLKEFR